MIGILADDLTSALDAAAPFATRGFPAHVRLCASGANGTAFVSSVDLDTRRAHEADAAKRFHKAAAAMADRPVLLKTMDSTLRGHVAVEVAATMRGGRRRRAIIAPAFPARGRTTVGGQQLLEGRLIEESDFAHDPHWPARTSDIRELLGPLPEASREIRDAETDEDLAGIVAAEGLSSDVLWVGSPGLAAAIAGALDGSLMPARQPPAVRRAERTIVVVGSLHPANAAQIGTLMARNVPVFYLCAKDHSDDLRVARSLREALAAHDVVALVSSRAAVECGPLDACRRLARIVGEVEAAFDGIVASGGDTARCVADRLHARGVDVLGEVEAGVPLGALKLAARPVAFAAKAGGFGDAATLARCVDQLAARGAGAA